MTIREAAIKHCKQQYIMTYSDELAEYVVIDFEAGYNYANEENKWVSVKDKLPEIGDEVIVYCPNCKQKITALVRLIRYEGATEFFWDNHYGGSNVHVQDAVTHWMPLPKPPKQ